MSDLVVVVLVRDEVGQVEHLGAERLSPRDCRPRENLVRRCGVRLVAESDVSPGQCSQDA
jgi:hypothetical protein